MIGISSFPPSRPALPSSFPCVAAALALALSLSVAAPVRAQGKSHGYITAGGGATQLNAGVELVLPGGPIAVGADVGLGWAFLGRLTASYHVARGGRHDLFATAGYGALGSSEFSSQGATVGGGAVLWPGRHVGLRFDAFKYLVIGRDDYVPADRRSASAYWGVRGGVAFRFR